MKNKFNIAFTLAVILTIVVTSLAFANTTPTITFEFSDYAPGDTVNLFGSGWQAGEPVHIFVNDNVGSTWNRNVDIVAASDGTIIDSFQLPTWFVAVYSVTATGETSGIVTTTFTDAANINTSTALNSISTPLTVGQTSVSFSGMVSVTSPDPNVANGAPVKFGYVSNSNCIGSFTQLGSTANTTSNNGSFIGTFTAPTSAGTYYVQAVFDEYNGSGTHWKQSSSNCQTITVNAAKTTPTITWSNPADILYGTALSVTQLNATASVAGTFVYTPAAGTVLSAGSHILHVDFTPTDTTLYNNASKDVTINVSPRPITVTAGAGQTKVYGESDPLAFTYSITSGSLVGTDAFTGALSRVAGENIGNYAIGQNTLALSTNYTLTYVGANFSITPRPITVTANAGQTKVYSNADPLAFTYSITSGSLAFSDAFTGALARDPGEDVGLYPITQGNLALTSNYTLTYVGADFSITPRPITVTANAGQTKVYGNADPLAFTYSITSGSLAFSDAFTGALARDPGEDVGLYPITQGNLALTSNYTLTYVGADFSITPRPITVTANAGQTKVYGNADPLAFTYSLTSGSLAFSDAFTGALARDPGEDVGLYPITQGNLALTSNYTLTYVGANFSITPRPITVTANAGQTKVYGNADPLAFTYSITSGSLAFSDAFTGALARDPGEDVGLYPITQGNLALTSNYTLTYVGADFSITPRPITVTANAGQTKVYGNADPLAFTYSITSGSLVGTDAFTGALSRVAGENIGNYAIGQNTLALSTNYTLAYVGADFSITPRPITVTANAGQTKVYGNADPLAFTYSLTSGSLAFSDAFTGALARDPGEDVGLYPITQGNLALTSNYTLTYVGADFSITPRPITVTANAGQTKVYGNADPLAFTYSITSGSLAFSDAFTGALARDPGEDVGLYPITQGNLALTSNYTLTYVGADFSITPRPITVTANAGQTKVYGNADPLAFTYSLTSGSLAFSDAFTGALARDPGEDVGLYPITQGNLALTSNYTLTYVGANFSITPRPITVTANAGQTKVYGNADPLAFTYSITSGSLAFSDAFTGALARDPGEDVGLYPITQGNLALTSNYTLTYVGADFSITPRPITVTANAGQTKVYGNADPLAFTYSITSGSLAFSDAFTGALSRVTGENVGNYAIEQNTLALTSNYTLTYVSANFSITKRDATWTTFPASKNYGTPDPSPLTTGSGNFLVADGVTAVYSRVAGETVAGSPYHISATLNAAAGILDNYNITNLGAAFTIKSWWTLKGFFSPVDMPNVWNTVKGGSTVPFKFKVFAGTTELTNISAIKDFTALAIACPVSSYTADAIDVLSTGGTSLRYDTTGGQFIYNWQTPKKPGSCYKITMTTADESFLSAWFILK